MNLLKKILPWIGAAATGNVPLLVSMAADTVGKAIGKPVKTAEDIAAAVAGASPEQLLALKQVDLDFQAKMQAMGFAHEDEIAKIEADDRANARARQIALKDWVTPALALLVTTGFFGCMFYVFRYGVKPESHDLTTIMLTTLATAWVGVIAYYFGSSAGSAEKSQLLADVTKK